MRSKVTHPGDARFEPGRSLSFQSQGTGRGIGE